MDPARTSAISSGEFQRAGTHADNRCSEEQMTVMLVRELAGSHPPDTQLCDRDVAELDVAWVVRRAASGDKHAWERSVDKCARLSWPITREFKFVESDAADVAQTMWMRPSERIGRLQHPERVGPWLAATARNECLGTSSRVRELSSPTRMTPSTAHSRMTRSSTRRSSTRSAHRIPVGSPHPKSWQIQRFSGLTVIQLMTLSVIQELGDRHHREPSDHDGAVLGNV